MSWNEPTGMSDSPENGLAAVELRARRTDGDLLPVTDLVTQILFDGNKTVRLTGEGKSTAIEHLRNAGTITSVFGMIQFQHKELIDGKLSERD